MLPNNLDYFVAESAIEIASSKADKDKKINGVQKAISILSSQGLFAMFLWSYAKTDYNFVADKFASVFKNSDLINFSECEDKKQVLDKLKYKLNNLVEIRFLEDISMKILIYARHYLKSL